jgi:hypothetical protein
MAKSQVSSLRRVRVSGQYLHRACQGRLAWAFMLLWCASPFSVPLRKSRDPFSVRDHAHDRTFVEWDSRLVVASRLTLGRSQQVRARRDTIVGYVVHVSAVDVFVELI